MSVIEPVIAHDLVFTLLGFEGDYFQRSDENLLITKRGLTHFQEWDLCVLRRILGTSQKYMAIRDWVDSSLGRPNVYSRGYALAVEEIVLTWYESDVAELEKEILFLSEQSSFTLSLTNIKSRICDQWDTILGLLVAVGSGEKEMDGGHIVDALMEMEAKCIEKFSQEIFSKLKSRMVSIFFREIAAWVQYGIGVSDELVIPRKLFDNQFHAKVLECGEFAKILGEETESVFPDDFTADENDFIVAEKIQKYVSDRNVELNREIVEFVKRKMNPSLDDHLSVIRGMFLLGFGDLWEEYILTKDWSVFEDARSGAELVKFSGNEIRMDVPDAPIGLIITSWHLERYKQLWQWLLGIKRCLVGLTRDEHAHAMVQFITNLFTYIQQDVIEEEWRKLKRAVETTEDFRSIQNAHDTFIDTIIGESMFALTSLKSGIDDIIDACSIVARTRLGRSSFDRREIEKRFSEKVSMFMSSLSELRLKSDFRRIDRLLLRLDYNRFYRR